jgi:hypothetical protein
MTFRTLTPRLSDLSIQILTLYLRPTRFLANCLVYRQCLLGEQFYRMCHLGEPFRFFLLHHLGERQFDQMPNLGEPFLRLLVQLASSPLMMLIPAALLVLFLLVRLLPSVFVKPLSAMLCFVLYGYYLLAPMPRIRLKTKFFFGLFARITYLSSFSLRTPRNEVLLLIVVI